MLEMIWVRTFFQASFSSCYPMLNSTNFIEQMSADNATGISISAVFVGRTAGAHLAALKDEDVILVINDELPFNINTQLILPFAILIGLCFLVMVRSMKLQNKVDF